MQLCLMLNMQKLDTIGNSKLPYAIATIHIQDD